MIDRLFSYIAPHYCRSCGEQGEIMCVDCKNDIIAEPPEVCLVCLQPAPHTNLCRSCRSAGVLDDAWFVGEREGSLRQLVDDYKFRSAREARSVLGLLLTNRIPLLADDVYVTAVPTTPRRRRELGFDHAKQLAEFVAKQRHLPYSDVLVALPHTAQHMKSRRERLRSSREAFTVNGKVPAKILLIDDIYTTGATVDACARLLREAGATEVYVGVIARQLLH